MLTPSSRFVDETRFLIIEIRGYVKDFRKNANFLYFARYKITRKINHLMTDSKQSDLGDFFRKKSVEFIHFDELVKLTRMVVKLNSSGHVVALESTYNGKNNGASARSRDRPNQVFFSSKCSCILSIL